MNHYPWWKNALIFTALAIGALYAAPNFFKSYPAVQISSKPNIKVDLALQQRVTRALEESKIEFLSSEMDGQSLRFRFSDTQKQIQARDQVQEALGDDYTVALNIESATPKWLRFVGGTPMYLGLDLRGGVHFLMQVDMDAVVRKAQAGYVDDVRRVLREEKNRYRSVNLLSGGKIEIRFTDATQREKGEQILREQLPELQQQAIEDDAALLRVNMSPEAVQDKRRFALEQNMTALRNRVNELGVAEPIVQQQGADRIVVQLPGVQDTARAKEILGRTATLEIKMVDDENNTQAISGGSIPFGSRLYPIQDGGRILLKNNIIYSGDNIVDSAPGFDSRSGLPIVTITLDAKGAAINQRVTGKNVGKRMAVVYVETKSEVKKDKYGKPKRITRRIEEVITAPVIQSQLGKRFQIEGIGSVQEANDLSLLLRAGSLAAPVEIIEERTVGPSLGKENIERGSSSTMWGFIAIAIFMVIYYLIFGIFSALALGTNLLLLLSLLSILQATLTLPGIAAIALTLGMAIDANVLINERIREELRGGMTPQAAIHAGYDRAFGTIFDSNITTLIAGLALLTFGTGPVRGFAVVHCLGILTSMFSSVLVSRSLVNFFYGARRRVERLAIGNTSWK